MLSTSIDPEQQFIKYHKKLRDELDHTSEHLEIFKGIMNIGKEYLDELNIAPTFFMLTIDAHKYAALMDLNKLLDTNPRHLGIYTFLDPTPVYSPA